MEPSAEWVAYEHPLSERIRFLLRLEFLFAQYEHERRDHSGWGVRAGLRTLLEMLSLMGRADLKVDLTKDLSEQHAVLARLSKRPEGGQPHGAEMLKELSAAVHGLQRMSSSHPAMVLRENEFLFGILNRSAIPGGTCSFDLPAYHCWLSRPGNQSLRDLDTWFSYLRPIDQAIRVYLRLLREGAAPVERTAEGGVYLHVPQASYQLVRVLVPAALGLFPEISAGKHRVSIRFMQFGDVDSRNVQASVNVPFRLQFCLLS
jgi:cell division protein ZapD